MPGGIGSGMAECALASVVCSSLNRTMRYPELFAWIAVVQTAQYIRHQTLAYSYIHLPNLLHKVVGE